MNMLIDELDYILLERIGNIEFDTNFRTSILFELLMQDPKVPKQTKVNQAIKLYYPNLSQIQDRQKAVEDIVWFYKCGKIEENKELANSEKKQPKKDKKQIYSYEFDDMYIYSAFLNQYQIDLQDIEYLHWWKFRALFEGLKKDNKIVEIMGYRAMNLSKIKDKKEQAEYRKLKKIYALPDMRSEQEKEKDFADALW